MMLTICEPVQALQFFGNPQNEPQTTSRLLLWLDLTLYHMCSKKTYDLI